MSNNNPLIELTEFIEKNYNIKIDILDFSANEIHQTFECHGIEYIKLTREMELHGKHELFDYLEIIDKIQKVLLNNKYGVAIGQLTLSASYVKDLGLDSLDIAELMMDYELTFRRMIPTQDTGKLITILDSVEYIYDKARIGEIII